MLIFRPQNFIVALLPFIAGNTHLSAFDIPVELPAGPTMHLNIKWFSVDLDSYSVSITTEIKDQEEIRLFSENPKVLGLMSQSIQEKWGLHNFEFRLRDPNEFRVNSCIDPSTAIVPTLLNLDFSSLFTSGNEGLLTHGSTILSGGTLILKNEQSLNVGAISGVGTLGAAGHGTLTLSGNSTYTGGTIVTAGKLVLPDPFSSSNADSSGTEEKNTPSETSSLNSHLQLENQDVKTTASIETPLIIGNTQNGAKEEPLTFNLSFSTVGSDFGGGWRLTPYELRFIKRQDTGINEMALLLASDRSELYQKEYRSSVFTSARSTSKSLRDNLDETYTLIVPTQGEFLFNSDGQLTNSIATNGICCAYDYSGKKLMNILYENRQIVSFEYAGERVLSINGLPNKIYLEYDERNLLCRIFDEQGFSLHFAYDEDNEFDKIVDETGAVIGFNHLTLNKSQIGDEVPLIFNGYGEIFYRKNSQNLWNFVYRAEDNDE